MNIKTLLVLPLAVFPVSSVVASSDEPEAAKPIEEIIVTATRSQHSVDTPALVTVISAEEIARSGAASVIDVLRNRGGVHITDLFGDGSRPTISIRGFGENAAQHALVLVNGRRLNNFDLGAPDLNSVALKDVERIEVVEGSASTLYGDQAVGGVINIITRSPNADDSRISLRAGSYSLREVEVATRQALDAGWGVGISALQRESDNYREHNRAEYSNVTLTVEHAGKDHQQVFDLQYVDDYLETPGALFADEVAQNRRQVTANFVDDFIETKTFNARLGFSGRISDAWDYELDVTGRDSDGRFLQSFSTFKNTVVTTQDRKIWTISPRVVGYIPTQSGEALWVTGVDYENIDYLLVSQFGPQRNKQDITSVYSRVIQPLSNEIEMTYGARYARSNNEVFDGAKFAAETPIEDEVWGGELGFRVVATDNAEAYGRIERVYRFGKIDEHTTFLTTGPLEPTEGYSYELGMEYAEGAFSSKLALWQIDLENEIAFDPNQFDNVNLPPTRRLGLTVLLALEASNSTYFSLTGSAVRAEVRSGSFEGNDVPLVPSYNLRVAVDQKLSRSVHALLEWQAVGKRVSSGDFNNNFEPLDDYNVVNLALNWDADEHAVTLRINNLLDARYSEFGAIGLNPNAGFVNDEAFQPAPEINANISYRYSF